MPGLNSAVMPFVALARDPHKPYLCPLHGFVRAPSHFVSTGTHQGTCCELRPGAAYVSSDGWLVWMKKNPGMRLPSFFDVNKDHRKRAPKRPRLG
jgi:hypothetical protein